MSAAGPAGPVALVGLSGTGKSSVAPKLAERWGSVAVDLDDCLAERFGASAQEVFRREGEAAFRRAERAELVRLLEDAGRAPAGLVLATGGGAVLDASNRESLRRCTVVWLRASVDELVERLRTADEPRPLLAGDARGALQRLEAERSVLYEAVADVVVDVDGVGVDEVVDRVAAAVAERR